MSEVYFELPAEPAAVAEARRRAAALEDLPEQAIADAELVVSELVTNSILHAGLGPQDTIEVSFRRLARALEIVVDDSDGFSAGRHRHPPARRSGGMGLKLLDAICDHWHADSGRVVATLSLGRAAPA